MRDDRGRSRPGTLVWTTLASVMFVALVAACGGDNDPVVTPTPTPTAEPTGPAMDHTNIVLRDAAGNPLTVADAAPYSPRQTCGECHDIDQAANGYHFQQGRTDASGAVVMKDDYFNDGRQWLKSAGMYGKW